MIWHSPPPSFGSWPSAKRPRDLRFFRLAPGAVAPPTRRDLRQRGSATPRQGACAHTARSTDLSSCPCSPPSLPLARRPQAVGRARLRPSAQGFFADLRGRLQSCGPVRSPSERSCAASAFSERASVVRCPGFGAVLIARSARVTGRGAGLVADPRSVSESAGGGEEAVALGACSRPMRWIPVTSSVVCSIVKGSSPHSVPVRLDPERDCGSDSVPIRSPWVPPRAKGRRIRPKRTRIPVADPCAAVGARLEPSGNPSGTCVAADEAGQAVPRLDRCGGPPWRSGS
jgi:hypothetical protein